MKSNKLLQKYKNEIIEHWGEYAYWDEYNEFDVDECNELFKTAHFGEDKDGNIIITNLNVKEGWGDYWECHNVAACFNKFGGLLWINAVDNDDYDF